MTATLPKILADFDTQLTAPVSAGDTTANLYTATDDDGVALPSGTYILTVDNSSSSKEYILASLSGTALTSIQSISRQGSATSGFARAHRRGAKVSLTDWAVLKRMLSYLDGTTGWDSGVKIGYDSDPGLISSDTLKLATVAYVNAVALAGAPNASPTVKGVVQEATQAQVLSKTASGSTGAELYVSPATLPSTLASDYKADTGSANAYAIAPSPAITAYTVGQQFSFKAANANTSASTLNVSALGTKTIKNSLSGDLVANDILAGQVVLVEYDGTNFQMLSNLGNQTATALKSATTVVSVSAATAPTSGQVLTATSGTAATWQTPTASLLGLVGSGSTTYDLSTASGVLNIPHGLGATPVIFNVTVVFSAANGQSSSAVAFNGHAISSYQDASAHQNLTTFRVSASSSAFQEAVITVTSTNIVLTWTKTSTPTGNANILWSALA